MEAAALVAERTGVTPAVYNIRYIKPLDEELVREAASKGMILTVEEGCIKGGLFGAVAEYLASEGIAIPVQGLGIPDEFIVQDKQASQRAACGLDAEGIAGKAVKMIENVEKN